jgi:nitrate/TMAO reductase-like tetraheme cytochrome c subunit
MSKQDWIIAAILSLATVLVIAIFGVAKPHANATSAKAAPDYLRSVYSPLHFKPAAETATNTECLACHREVLDDRVRDKSPAGVPAQTAMAWYQQVSTYVGEQDTFHRRHIETPLAKRLMNLQCNTCHQGHDPREEAPGSSADVGQNTSDITLRKQVNPETVCLKCHGQMPANEIMGLPGPWPGVKDAFQDNCLICHANIRTNRHNVSYLNAAAIEAMAQENGGDACYGCHGGRAWYRIAYPYPRHPWPGMAADVPAWAKDRPTLSEPRFAKSANLNRFLQPTP